MKKRKNILYVEDETDSILIVKRMLKNYNLFICDNGKEMYDHLDKIKFDLILMDIGLPGTKNGLKLIEALKNNDQFSRIPVLCITSYVHKDQLSNVLQAGADGYLTKPFSKQAAINQIVRLIGM